LFCNAFLSISRVAKESQVSVEELMNVRNEMFQDLINKPLKLDNDVTVIFESKLFIADIGFLLKLLNKGDDYCLFCKENICKCDSWVAARQKTMVSFGDLLREGGHEKLANDEDKWKTELYPDSLHTLKGTFEDLRSTLKKTDGVPKDLTDAMVMSYLKKLDSSGLSGSHYRLFMLQSDSWVKELGEILAVSSAPKGVAERYQQTQGNLSLITYLFGELCGLLYMNKKSTEDPESESEEEGCSELEDENNKQDGENDNESDNNEKQTIEKSKEELEREAKEQEIRNRDQCYVGFILLSFVTNNHGQIESISFLLYVLLTKRYGDGWRKRHQHNLIFHFAEVFLKRNIRDTNTERAEGAFSTLKKVVRTETNHQIQNVLETCVLAQVGSILRYVNHRVKPKRSSILSKISDVASKRQRSNFKIPATIRTRNPEFDKEIEQFLIFANSKGFSNYIKEEEDGSINFKFSESWQYRTDEFWFETADLPTVEPPAPQLKCGCGKRASAECNGAEASEKINLCVTCCLHQRVKTATKSESASIPACQYAGHNCKQMVDRMLQRVVKKVGIPAASAEGAKEQMELEKTAEIQEFLEGGTTIEQRKRGQAEPKEKCGECNKKFLAKKCSQKVCKSCCSDRNCPSHKVKSKTSPKRRRITK
jgi:hypothetical protein